MKKLKEYRIKNNFSTQFMAEMLGISKTFYWHIENDKKRLSYDLAIEIAKIFHMTPDELFYDEFINKK